MIYSLSNKITLIEGISQKILHVRKADEAIMGAAVR